MPALAARLGVPVAAKCEHLQPVGAFKIRGAYTAVSRIPAGPARSRSDHLLQREPRPGGRLCRPPPRYPRRRRHAGAGSGHQGRGGQAAGRRGGPCRQQLGRAVRSGRVALAEERGLTMVPPYESLDVIAGPGNLRPRDPRSPARGRDHPGAGGRRRSHRRHCRGRCRAQAVGPGDRGRAGWPRPSWPGPSQPGQPTQLELAASLADGLLPLSIGELPFAVLSGVVREAVQVSEDEIAAAVRYLYR